jgi:hypothetical protein
MRMTVTAAMCLLATAGMATAAGDALRCHPDLKGTRSFTVNADVNAYSFVRGHVDVDWVRGRDCAGTAVWNYSSQSRTKAAASCQHAAGHPAPGAETSLVAAQGNRLVRAVLAPASSDSPDRLDVFERATHRRRASWPLFERPARVALYNGIAILSEAKRHALYALRVADGRIAMLGIARANDRPLIGPSGVLYQDDLDLAMHRASPHTVTLKLLPLATVRREIAARGARQISTSRINAISMDGKRVAFVAHDPEGKCDRVLFWSIPWHFVSRLTQRVGPTCLPTHAAGGITDVAIAGDRAVWTTRYGTHTRVLAASIINCVEWVVARPVVGVQRVAGLSGDGGVLAFALRGNVHASTVGLVPGHWRSVEIARSNSRIAGISVDSHRVAVLHADGTLAIVARGGRLTGRLFVGKARGIALRRHTVAVLRRAKLDVYETVSGRRIGSWNVPANARSVDLQYGIALVAAGRDAIAVNTKTGRTARLLHAPGRVAAQIEEPGAAVQFNIGDRGYLRFIPMSVIESRTR